MKKIILLLCLLHLFVFVKAQKENNIWVGGVQSGLNFNSGDPIPFFRNDNIDFSGSNASISNKNGQLLFYTNGYKIYNKNFQLMQNGNNLNIGDYESWGYNLLGIEDGAAIIPLPGDSMKYYVFHEDLNYSSYDTQTNVLMPTHLFYCIVDMNSNGGLGQVIQSQKDVVILSDTLIGCGFKIVKHANGRDYWLLCHEMNSDTYYRFLIDPYGIHGPFIQHYGYVFKGKNGLGFSSLIFNKKETMAAQLNSDSTSVQLYDFDRCTGEFSNLRNFKVSDTLYHVLGGEFSPDGKYLYVTCKGWKLIWQFDITTPDIFQSRKLIAVYDGAMNPFPTNFSEMRLAPDDKIYIHSYDWNHSIHVINYPDSVGSACGFVENAIQINPPGFNWNGFPNIINYSLGALPGACDTLTSANNLSESTFTFGVYPNPFTNELQLSISGANTAATVEVFNILGQKILAHTIQPANNFVHDKIDLTNLAPAIYILRIGVNGKEFIKKVVKTHP